MLTLAEAEKQHDEINARLRALRRAIRTSQNIDGIEDEIAKLKIEARALFNAVRKHQAIAEYLANCECYGGIH